MHNQKEKQSEPVTESEKTKSVATQTDPYIPYVHKPIPRPIVSILTRDVHMQHIANRALTDSATLAALEGLSKLAAGK